MHFLLAARKERGKKGRQTDEIGLKFVKRSGWGVDVMIGLTLTPPPPHQDSFIPSMRFFDAMLHDTPLECGMG